MLEKDFYQLCEDSLVKLSQQIEGLDANSKLDVDYSDGILTIILEENAKTYIINRHSASQKIWYSSPFSGASYFSYNSEIKAWMSSNNEELSQKLFSELKTIL
jgi:iron donor protein CyaY